jgi:single-stranded-DNA-specific exonuclease
VLTQWKVATPDPATSDRLAAALSLSPLLCQILINRGITDAAAARKFLTPSLHDLHDAYLLFGMDVAVQRIVAAITQGEQMAVYGDYDVDGVTGTALLLTFFEALGLRVTSYIPEREGEGYGLNPEAMRRLAQHGTRLLITVDCGSTALAEIALARELGIDTIITDHHQPPETLPEALAILNPHQPACGYPNKHLCGVGLVFKLLTALRAFMRQAGVLPERLPNLKRHLDLAALGTIADVTPIRGENRIIVHHGLQELAQTLKPGLQALRQVSGRRGKPASVGEVGFQLAPRLNASGRLGSAAQSLQLLMARDHEAAERLAASLDEVNQQRRTLQRQVEQTVHERIDRQYGGTPPAAIVLGDADWHLGVVGIVAARVAETYHRPTFLLQINGGTARGSGRSIPAFDLYDGLQHCAEWLEQFGGHRYAAGLTMAADNLPALQEAFIRYADDRLGPDDLRPVLRLEAVVPLADINQAMVDELAVLAPHGSGNPAPVFAACGVRIASPVRRLGREGQHARFRVEQDGHALEVIAFQKADRVAQAAASGGMLDIAFIPAVNTWRDRRTLELQLRDLRPHAPNSH